MEIIKGKNASARVFSDTMEVYAGVQIQNICDNDVSFGQSICVMPELSEIAEAKNVEWQFFRCGGNGGQNVNKVETGVRLIHKETGTVITCTEERSQALNRKRALEKLNSELKNLESAERSKLGAASWSSSNGIVRGNPVRIYEGKRFKLIN